METVVLFMVILVMSALRAEESLKIVPGQCILPLGMEEGKIPDDAITASSSYELKSVGPQNARIRQEKNGGAWCPKAQISSNIREYLEVDLTKDHLITWTETQGRFGNGQGQEYAEAFFLEYWRDDKWHQYRNLRGDRVLRGNSNTYLVERQKLELPFVASRVRFVPYSQHPRTVCMRVEIYGCVWEQRLASYAAPKGEAFGPNGCNAEDNSYDGAETDGGLLTGGLGQLTDGIFGDEAETTVSSAGSNWVGWCDRGTVELVFEFREPREFENCTVHLAHSPELGIEVFSALYVWFSADGKQYHPTAEKLEVSDEIKTRTISLSVALPARIGKFVKLEFHTKSKWLLISEVTFETVSDLRNATTDQSAEPYPRRAGNDNETIPERSSSRPSSPSSNETIYEPNANLTPDAFPVNNSQTYIGLASGALTVVALLLTCTVFLMKQRGRNKVALLQKHTALLCGSPAPGITINMKDIKLPTPIVVNNGLSQSRLSVKSAKTIANDEQAQHEINPGGHDYERCSAYERTYKLFSDENLAYEPHTHKPEHFSSCKSDYSDLTSERSFQEEKFAERIVPTPFPAKKMSHAQPSKPSHKVYESYYAATDILTIKRREQPASTSLFTPLHIREGMHHANKVNTYNVPRISRHRLRILDKLGEGGFGLVHLCEAKGIQNPDLGTIRNRQVVIVRSLWRGVIDSLKEDFAKDMYSLATIRDINIARIIALVEEEPLGAVFEYGELGDLPTFFENHEKSDNDLPISYGCLLNFITQIASGMKYLENLNIPHCDLAARNCIVSQNLLIKVSDHAMYCSKYDHEYYVGGCYTKIPLRWMAWEAVLLGKQSCQSDVWSYAVTTWEILTSCKDTPHADMTSEQVLENLSRWYHGAGSAGNASEKNQPRILAQPACCSSELYRMMVKCWSKHAEDRPTFDEIYLYLKRLGFD